VSPGACKAFELGSATFSVTASFGMMYATSASRSDGIASTVEKKRPSKDSEVPSMPRSSTFTVKLWVRNERRPLPEQVLLPISSRLWETFCITPSIRHENVASEFAKNAVIAVPTFFS